MSENKYCEVPSRQEIQSMSTPELTELLRRESFKPSNSSSDTELIFYILEVLDSREDAQDSAPKISPKEAFEKFRKLYLNPAEEEKSMNDAWNAESSENHRTTHFPKWLRTVAAAAAVLAVVIIVGGMTIKASGVDPWSLFAYWTEDIFYFSNGKTPPPEIPEADISTLEEMLAKHSVYFPAVPRRLPEGYELIDVYENVSPRYASIVAEFMRGADSLVYTLQYRTDEAYSAIAQKDGEPVETYTVNGQIHYIFSNLDITHAQWVVDNCVLFIYGPITRDEMKQIIDSFYEGN